MIADRHVSHRAKEKHYLKRRYTLTKNGSVMTCSRDAAHKKRIPRSLIKKGETGLVGLRTRDPCNGKLLLTV